MSPPLDHGGDVVDLVLAWSCRTGRQRPALGSGHAAFSVDRTVWRNAAPSLASLAAPTWTVLLERLTTKVLVGVAGVVDAEGVQPGTVEVQVGALRPACVQTRQLLVYVSSKVVTDILAVLGTVVYAQLSL